MLPDQVTSKLKKDYIKSIILELLPIVIFFAYYNYYLQMKEHDHKWNFLWQKWYIDHEDGN